MKITEFEKKYLFTTRIDLDDDDFVEMREPNTQELSQFGENDKKNLEHLEKIFPSCLIASSFINENEEEATGKEVYNALKKSGSMFSEILTTWMNSIPFQSRLTKNKK